MYYWARQTDVALLRERKSSPASDSRHRCWQQATIRPLTRGCPPNWLSLHKVKLRGKPLASLMSSGKYCYVMASVNLLGTETSLFREDFRRVDSSITTIPTNWQILKIIYYGSFSSCTTIDISTARWGRMDPLLLRDPFRKTSGTISPHQNAQYLTSRCAEVRKVATSRTGFVFHSIQEPWLSNICWQQLWFRAAWNLS